jgi:hypothetical protein
MAKTSLRKNVFILLGSAHMPTVACCDMPSSPLKRFSTKEVHQFIGGWRPVHCKTSDRAFENPPNSADITIPRSGGSQQHFIAASNI